MQLHVTNDVTNISFSVTSGAYLQFESDYENSYDPVVTNYGSASPNFIVGEEYPQVANFNRPNDATAQNLFLNLGTVPFTVDLGPVTVQQKEVTYRIIATYANYDSNRNTVQNLKDIHGNNFQQYYKEHYVINIIRNAS